MYIKVINGLPMACIVFRLLAHLLIMKIKKETNKQQQKKKKKKEKKKEKNSECYRNQFRIVFSLYLI